MVIREAHANFGALSGESLRLDPEFNVITLPNEGGKSTWCAFIRVMLYGIDTRERDRAPSKDAPLGHVADKKRYAPWNGTPMSGRLVVESDGRVIEITRSSGSAGPMQNFSAVYADSGMAVPGMTGENCGLMLCGVSAEGYAKSAFIGSGGVIVSGSSPELENRINALVTTGSEEVSETELQSRLRRIGNDISVNRSVGAAARVAARRNEAQRKLDALSRTVSDEREWNAKRIKTASELAHIRSELVTIEKYEKYELFENIKAAERSAAAADAELNGIKDKANERGIITDPEWCVHARHTLSALLLTEDAAKLARERQVRSADAAEKAKAVYNEAAEACENVKQKRPAAVIPLAAAAVVLAAACIVFAVLKMTVFCAVSGAVGAVSAIIAGFLEKTSRKAAAETLTERKTALSEARVRYELAAERADEEKSALETEENEAEKARSALGSAFEPCGISPDTPAEAEAHISATERIISALEKAQAAKDAAYARLSAFQTADVPENAEKPTEKRPERSSEELEYQKRRLGEELMNAERECASLAGQARVIGDPAELAAEAYETGKMLEILESRLKAVKLASKAVADAADELRGSTSPRIAAAAAEMLYEMTDGRYSRFEIKNGFLASAARGDADAAASAAVLSTGTADQIYLALRLAVSLTALCDKRPPVILDDALLAFDDKRTFAAIGMLKKLSKEHQIILFTCRSTYKD